MDDELFATAAFMRQALDAIPSIVLVTDADVRILFRNKAAAALLSGDKVYSSRAGEVMHCIHSEDVPGGCGRGPHCKDCLVRNSVADAFSRKSVTRRRADVSLRTGDKTSIIPVMVSAAPFSFGGSIYALLVIEDVTELAELRSLLPICASCKRILAEDGSWEKVESYIKRNVPKVQLSHGLCPACSKKLYPGYSQ